MPIRNTTHIVAALASCLIYNSFGAAYAQDITELGGDLTNHVFYNRNAIQLTAPNVSSEETRLEQLNGFSIFHKIFAKSEGLGPVFNHNSCGSCHVNNGRGRVGIDPIAPGTPMVVKVSLKGMNENGAPTDVPGVGEQIRNHRVNGKRLFDLRLRWKEVKGKYPDGTTYTLRKPDIDFKIPGYPKRKIRESIRATSPVFGPGLLEAISEDTILALSDPNDLNNDGISGKPQYVPDIRSSTKKIGRFGWRASHTTTEQQSSAAAFNDMGVTNALFPGSTGGSSELSGADLYLLTIYQQLGGMPAAQNQDDSTVIRGKELFQQVGCDDCHVMTLTTGTHTLSELSNQTIHPFTDLLLHNMGSGLADKRREFEALGAEWKTAPLWGLGFSIKLGSKASFLHDGRARTITEAILWHGGESAKSRDDFKSLSKADRSALITFLKSL